MAPLPRKRASRSSSGVPLPLMVGAIAAFVLVAGVVLAWIYYQAPRSAYESLRAAAAAGDMATIQQYVDFPQLRASVKSTLIAAGEAELGLEGRAMLRFGRAVADAALDPVVDLAVSAPGISLLLDGFAPVAGGDAGSAGARSAPEVERMDFVSLDVFVVSVHQPTAQNWELQLFFARDGLFGWKLASIQPIYQKS